MADEPNRPESRAVQIVQETQEWAEARRAEGWTRDDFIRGLKEFLGFPTGHEETDGD